MPQIRPDGLWLKDEYGRTLILRGVNIGGSSKVPRKPNGASHRLERFFDHRDVSFVGRPFPLDEASEHFERLKAWGLTTVRLVVTWEAIEHAGPGIYDDDYLDYIVSLCERAAAHHITLFVDPHQDVWSRFCGGDGAPGWTLEAAGLDMRRFAETGAAIVHATHGDPLPHMIWPANAHKLATATMFTLFFGGDIFAPGVMVDGQPIQRFLQGHYRAALARLAGRLRHLPNVIGYGLMNEPLSGYIGRADLDKTAGLPRLGPCPTPLQSMLLGAGYPQEVDVWDQSYLIPRPVDRQWVNGGGVRAWLKNHDPIWRAHGVWDLDGDGQARLLQPGYFTMVNGQSVDFVADFYRPFVEDTIAVIQAAHPGALIFLEPPLHHNPPRFSPPLSGGLVYAPHWYDVLTLFLKRYSRLAAADAAKGRPVFSPWFIRHSFRRQLQNLAAEATGYLEGAPTLIGEVGIPFDLGDGEAYRSGDFSVQIEAMDRCLRALDDTLMSYTLWNYTPDNNNVRGDLWNGEDLSIFSRDQQDDPVDIHSGGRALEAVVRPYPRATAGQPLRLAFDHRRRLFVYTFRHDPAVDAPTELFVPGYHYPHGYSVRVSGGRYEIDRDNQRLLYWPTGASLEHTITIDAPR